MKNRLSGKKYVIFIVIIIIIILLLIFGYNKLNKKPNNGGGKDSSITRDLEEYPAIVRELYSNNINVSCYGDLYLNLELDESSKSVSDMSDKNILDMIFSYLDKNDKLGDGLKVSDIKNASNELFAAKVDVSNKIKDYSYGNYIYSISGDKVTRKDYKCSSDKKYVSYLMAYFYSDKDLFMDVNMGYLVGDTMYDLSDRVLGKYDGDVLKLSSLFDRSSYYRYNFTDEKGIYKLKSVSWKNKILD